MCSSDLGDVRLVGGVEENDRIVFTGEFHPGGERLAAGHRSGGIVGVAEVDQVDRSVGQGGHRSEEHTSELQSLVNLVCRLLLEKKKKSKTLPPH
mgnify:CR=1 FL=1